MPLLGPPMDGKNEIFQRLKPICVALSQAALALQGPQGNIKIVTDHLEILQHTLRSATTSANALDSKLADYVFFPVSQVLKVSQRASIRCLELCLQCLATLIDQGWRHHMQPPLAAQIVILCSLLGEKKPKGFSFSETTDELQASAFWCLYHLFAIQAIGTDCQKLLTSQSNFPQLGQTISVILDGISDDGSPEAQNAATSALDALTENVADREIHAAFMPGIVSKLTRVLTPQTKLRRSHSVLIGCLNVLEVLLRSTMSDGLSNPTSNGTGDAKLDVQQQRKSAVDLKWQEDAATQLKPALNNIIRLRSHSKDDVKERLAQLCVVIIGNCRKTLSNCLIMALETLITISLGQHDKVVIVELGKLLHADSSLTSLLQDMLYDWLQSLTTVMQGSDEQAKASKLQQIRTAYELLVRREWDTSTIDRMLASTLRDSVVVTLAAPSAKQQAVSFADPIQSLDLTVVRNDENVTGFSSPLVSYKAQQECMEGIEELTRMISSSTPTRDFASDLARSLRQSHGETHMANFWLLLTATQTALQRKNQVDDFLNLENESSSAYHEYLEELYSLSLSILSDISDEEPDPRLKALALRGLSLCAESAGRDFRYELVDALYPVLHTLATPNEQLQRDSITTLNMFTSACGYTSIKDLVVENVDYITNAVALKLNAFDVSPQAPQVLLMVVRLTGSRLLPYLEDTVDSIFAALKAYHGYPLLVELLFKVLGVVAEEGVKAPQLAITDSSTKEESVIRIAKWQPTSISGLSGVLRLRAEEEIEANKLDSDAHEPHPKQPWKSIGELADENEEESQAVDDQDQQLDDAEPPPPAPKTYNLLLRITELTQHFLPSAAPSLRTSLLALIRTTVPAIARHENSFLPLVNTLWPEIVSRLDDGEPHIVASALEIVGMLCECAGDFMRSRIVQLWPRVVEIYQGTARDLVQANSHDRAGSKQQDTALMPNSVHLKSVLSRMQATPENYGDTSSRLLWSALTSSIANIVQYVSLPPELVDSALEICESVLDYTTLRCAFERENADAFWLARIRTGAIGTPRFPRIPEGFEWQFAEVPG